jgi:hypothetical protein
MNNGNVSLEDISLEKSRQTPLLIGQMILRFDGSNADHLLRTQSFVFSSASLRESFYLSTVKMIAQATTD